MKVAVACDGLGVSAHAARCDSYMCYAVSKGTITECRNLPNMASNSHDAAQLIIDLGFDTIISGGIDMDMANELCAANVEVVAGVSGTAREVMDAYLSNTLMGEAMELCQVSQADEADIDAAFDEIAARFEKTV